MRNLQFTMYDVFLKNRNIFFILYFFFFTLSCQHSNKNDIKDASPYFSNFYKDNDEAVLRGVNFNMNIDEVKKTELSKLYETTTDHLFYEFTFPKDSTVFSEYANVQYFFNENNQLDIITADIYLNDSIQQIKIINTLTEYFNQRYGTSETNSNDYNVWTGSFTDKATDKEYSYTISLKDMEDDSGVSIEYYLQR